jgi:rubrerythrin
MYHALQACDTYEQYAQDAEQQGNREVAQFFRDVLQQNQQCAQRGQQILLQCLQQESRGKGQMMQGGSSGQGQQAGGSSQGQQSSGGAGGQQGRGNR